MLPDIVIVAVVSLLASGLTLFSGFGLGTLLMPAFALVFPVPVAIAATAVVHLANNLFKLGLLGRHADWPVALRFGVPAALASLLGALTMVAVAASDKALDYSAFGRSMTTTPVDLVIGLLITAFAVLELRGRLQGLRISAGLLPLGGLVSGFFGGLSGNQGALRSAFLIKAGLDKQAFVATGVVSAVMVDTVRIGVYGSAFAASGLDAAIAGPGAPLVLLACIAAFLGAYIGKRLLGKVTLLAVRRIVAIGMVLVGIGLAAGLV